MVSIYGGDHVPRFDGTLRGHASTERDQPLALQLCQAKHSGGMSPHISPMLWGLIDMPPVWKVTPVGGEVRSIPILDHCYNYMYNLLLT